MFIKKLLCSAAILTVAATFASCSNGIKKDAALLSRSFDGKEIIPDDATSICIVKIEEPDAAGTIAGTLTVDLKRKINSERRLHVIDNPDTCDVTVIVRLLPVITKPLKFNDAGVPETYRLRLDCFVTLVHKSTGEEILKNKDVYAEFVYTDTGKEAMSEYRAITRLTEQLADRILSVIITGWYKEDNQRQTRGSSEPEKIPDIQAVFI